MSFRTPLFKSGGIAVIRPLPVSDFYHKIRLKSNAKDEIHR
jgi:hypothetical protein